MRINRRQRLQRKALDGLIDKYKDQPPAHIDCIMGIEKPIVISDKIWRVEPNLIPLTDTRTEPTGARWILWVLRGRPESWVKKEQGLLSKMAKN